MLPDIDQILVTETDASNSKGERSFDLEKTKEAIHTADGNDPARLIPLYIDLIRFLTQESNYSEALASINKALTLPVDPPEQMELFLLQGVCLARTGSLAQAEDCFLQAGENCRKRNDLAGLARSLYLMASYVLVIRGKFNLALAYIEEAQTNFAISGYTHWGAPWLRTYIHLIKGDLHHARQILFEMARTIEPAKAIAGAYYFLWSRMAIADEEYEQAREYLRLGLRIAMQTGITELRLWFHLEQARFHRSINQYPIAREWADEACTQAKRSGLAYFEAAAHLELAQISWLDNDISTAYDELHQAETIYTYLDANYDLAFTLFLKAFWSHHHRNPQAEAAWIQAATAILRGGYAFILEREQDSAFHLTAGWLHNGNDQSRMLAEQLLDQLANVPPQPLRILGLGQFSVWKGRQYIPDKAWLRRRAGELFRFLLIQPKRTASKDTILDTLWPDNDPDSASGLLHQATSTLRRLLEPDLPEKFPSRYLINEGEQLYLRLPLSSLVDFELFAENLRTAITKRRADQIKESLLNYKGILFPQDQYSDWSTELRTRLADLQLEGLVALATIHLENERYADAIECVHQVLLLDPWNEDAVMIGMKTHLSLGSAPHALRLYNQLKSTLDTDLHLPPREELRALADRIRTPSSK